MQARFVLSGLLVLWALCPARVAAQGYLCGKSAPPVITVNVVTGPVTFDTKQSADALRHIEIDTVSPWPETYHTAVGGIMQGRISADHKITFNRAKDVKRGSACVWFERIDVTLRADPKIYIANDLQDKTCWFREVFAHEAKHVAEDHALLERYKQRVKDGLYMVFSTHADYASGPVPLVGLKATQGQMKENVTQALNAMFAMMARERAQRQQSLDNLGEYIKISRGC